MDVDASRSNTRLPVTWLRTTIQAITAESKATSVALSAATTTVFRRAGRKRWSLSTLAKALNETLPSRAQSVGGR